MKKILAILALTLATTASFANNVVLSNIGIGGQNTANHYSMVGFDINWENSWRTSTNESNYDGSWVFVKFRKQGSNTWEHATINATGHTVPTGSIITASADGKGVFIYRSANGNGTVNYTGAKLRWNYGADGVLDNDSVEVRVYAVEMVYVTAGKFFMGSGGTETNRVVTYGTGAPTANPYQVTSNGAITVGVTTGNLYYGPNQYQTTGDQNGPIPAAYPEGYDSFWVMKYECSQQQYADFLNSLDATRATNRNVGSSQFTGTHPNLVPAQATRALGSAGPDDLMAYADWAGLRPMSEMEYEKACRGYNQTPTPNEYAWGNTTITAPGTFTNAGLDNETTASGNCIYATGSPRRCGIFATATSNRTSSGGTYYGVMEMSGNVQELTVSIGSTASRAFTAATHGDGNLDNTGKTDITTWSALSTSYSWALKGGAYPSAVTECAISYRGNAAATLGRDGTFGIRLVRTAP